MSASDSNSDIEIIHDSRDRHYTGYNFAEIHAGLEEGMKWAAWEFAHAALNEDEEDGKLTIPDIVDMILDEFPGLYQKHALLNTLRNNMSISPDFIAIEKLGSKRWWVLTGSIEGVPRPDKKAARAKASKKRQQVKAREQVHKTAASSKRTKKAAPVKKKAAVSGPSAAIKVADSDEDMSDVDQEMANNTTVEVTVPTAIREPAPVPVLNVMGNPNIPAFIPFVPQANIFPNAFGLGISHFAPHYLSSHATFASEEQEPEPHA